MVLSTVIMSIDFYPEGHFPTQMLANAELVGTSPGEMLHNII